MPLTGFDMSLLNKKYDAMMKSADADLIRANAAAASAGGGGGGGGGYDVNPLEGLQSDLLKSEIAKNNAAAAGARSAASIAEDQNLEAQRLNDQNYNSNTLSREQAAKYFDLFGNQVDPEKTPPSNKKGLAKVPKTGKTTVHKGEAILNKPAADAMGRGMIAALNIKGMQKMGMV